MNLNSNNVKRWITDYKMVKRSLEATEDRVQYRCKKQIKMSEGGERRAQTHMYIKATLIVHPEGLRGNIIIKGSSHQEERSSSSAGLCRQEYKPWTCWTIDIRRVIWKWQTSRDEQRHRLCALRTSWGSHSPLHWYHFLRWFIATVGDLNQMSVIQRNRDSLKQEISKKVRK